LIASREPQPPSYSASQRWWTGRSIIRDRLMSQLPSPCACRRRWRGI
jgi:hypothetical protein